ncbi:MAG: hypothetical protein RO257_16925 [Candidatus Kapabacteria bacterium]|nr:hypothetical protein [Candidatus Kapabacteria bacterium]
MKSTNKDWSDLNLENEEIELLESIENGEWQSIGNIEDRKNNLRNFFLKNNENSNSVKIEIDKDVFNLLISKSNQSGVSYKELIEKMIRNFTVGKVAF